MQVHFDLSEDIAQALTAGGGDLDLAARQSIALEGYRSGKLSEEQIRRLLGFGSRFEVHAFLKANQVYLNYTELDLDHDLATARKFGSRS